MPNRTQQPEIQTLEDIQLMDFQTTRLSNGIPVFVFSGGSEEVTKIDVNFYAGTWHQDLPLVAPSVGQLMTAGTGQRTAHEIAGYIDFFGASLVSTADRDMSLVSMLSLNRHLDKMLALMEDVTKNPSFPDKEIDIYARNQQQRLNVNEQKVNYLAKTRFANYLYGDNHPYGKYLKEAYFENLTRQNLHDFHQKHYNAQNCYILISGKVPEKALELADRHFGGDDWNGLPASEKNYEVESVQPGEYHIPKPGAVQKAIRMGKVLFDRTHPDYPAMKIVSTILGGYFGSRLMKNIREDKGYTYGIFSNIISLRKEGYFMISAETGSDVTQKAIEEIHKEIEKLQTTLVEDEELETVRNYMLGNVSRMIDGPLAAGDFYKTLYESGLDESYLHNFVSTIRSIEKDQIRDLANKYLDKEDFIQIEAGG
ncbi:MAG: insulinase family protein [Bacteroidales bacterium]|nr:insulinase family protein [Bacteroidales bacterium]